MLTIYGIPNCDTCKKTRKWLEANSVEHQFHDLRIDGLDKTMLQHWTEQVGWQKLLNTRSKTWRGLAESERQYINETRARKLMLIHPTLVKRPVLDNGTLVLVGFSATMYADITGA